MLNSHSPQTHVLLAMSEHLAQLQSQRVSLELLLLAGLANSGERRRDHCDNDDCTSDGRL